MLEPIISKVSIGGHPLHPLIIHFPIAALIGLVGSDLGYLFTQDFFWARASLWLAGVGALVGTLGGIAGLIDLLAMPRVRRLVAAWSHAILAVMLLSVTILNWLLRITEPDVYILPWGLYLSILAAALIAITGYFGGLLVYEFAIGVDVEEAEQHQEED